MLQLGHTHTLDEYAKNDHLLCLSTVVNVLCALKKTVACKWIVYYATSLRLTNTIAVNAANQVIVPVIARKLSRLCDESNGSIFIYPLHNE